jgi:hypothetical protein
LCCDDAAAMGRQPKISSKKAFMAMKARLLTVSL